MMKTRLLKVNFALCLICITTLFCATGFADIVRTWAIHSSCTDNVSTLSSGATSLLRTDHTILTVQDDVPVCVKITKGTTETGWTFAGDTDNDGKVLSSTEATDFDTAATNANKNSFRLVQWKIGDATASSGWYDPNYDKIAVMDDGNANTLAHEVGHFATCDGVEWPVDRIMYEYWSNIKNTVSSDDKTKYEAIN